MVKKSKLRFILTCYVLSIIWIPLLLFIYQFFHKFKYLLKIYLKIRYNKQFVGFIEGADVLWALGKPHDSTIDIVIVFTAKDSKYLVEQLKKRISIKVLMNKNKYPILTSTYHTIFSYIYLLRSKCTVEDIMSTIEITKESDNFEKNYEDIFRDCVKKDLPLDDTLLWQVVTINASTAWRTKNNLKEEQHPVLFRIYHGVGDRISIISNLVNIFSDTPINRTHLIPDSKKTSTKKMNFIQTYLYYFHMLMLTPGFLILRKFWKDGSKYVNVYESQNISGDTDYCFITDDGTAVETINRIKKKIGDTSFIEVAFTAISKSLQKFFSSSTGSNIPDIALQILPINSPIQSNPEKLNEFSNKFTILRLPLPILLKSDSLVLRLKEVKKYTRSSKIKIDYQVRDFCWNYLLRVLPPIFILPLKKFENLGMALSNITGCPKISCFGLEINQIYFVPPQYSIIGCCVTLFTYNNNLNVSIRADKTFSMSKELSRQIGIDILKNIKQFDEEINAKES